MKSKRGGFRKTEQEELVQRQAPRAAHGRRTGLRQAKRAETGYAPKARRRA